jgi:penicillin-binding protein 1A
VRIQKQADLALKNFLKNNKVKASQGAVLVLDNSGAIKAMVGGENYRKSPFNRATQAQRQSGSAFKLFVYLAALEQGYTASSLFEDKRRTYGKKWSPKNYKNQYLGTVSLSTAFAKSLNTVAVHLCDELGPASVIKMARNLGITSPIPPNLSIALGSCDNTLLELTSSYGVIANMGQEMRSFGILSIITRENQELYTHALEASSQVLDSAIAGQMHELLREVVENGTGRKAGIPGADISGKTGTTQNHKDAWFIGYTNTHIIGVWIGNDNGSPMKEATGGSGPTIIFKDIVQKINSGEERGSIESILQELGE